MLSRMRKLLPLRMLLYRVLLWLLPRLLLSTVLLVSHNTSAMAVAFSGDQRLPRLEIMVLMILGGGTARGDPKIGSSTPFLAHTGESV